ncbi:MAG: class I SAM-dependent methyltransferase [Pyrinomonadaceae bacterium]|nr:class I SAM-dependent methyltransferase [Phycisphaerales bacterium]
MLADGQRSELFTHKYRDEFTFWVALEHGDCARQFGCSAWDLFRHWQTIRMTELSQALKLAGLDELKTWASERSAVEIGPGPFPSIAIAPWRRAVAVDPLADGYSRENLVPPDAAHVVFLASAAEQIPLPSGFADLFVTENCLDHVDDPAAVLREAARLLAPEGYVWLLVDLMDYRDLMHPHPFSEQTLHELFKDTGFEVVMEWIGPNKSHPNAYAQYRCLLRQGPTRVEASI